MASTSVRDWLDRRTGYRALLSHLLDEPIQGGPRWAYVFGALLLITLGNQVLTGLLLMAFYAPSATDAWASVAYIQDQLRLGWFVRGMHAMGASLMVVGMVLHMVQVSVYGAYRAPREVNWWTGILLSLLVLGFALTGYLLPWDQKGYWATQVATTLLGATPVVGEALQTLLQGGATYGNLTLTHFYSLHVFVLPSLLITLVLVHVALFRRHGVTTRWGRSAAELAAQTEAFWPRQAVYDMTAGALGLIVIAGIVIGAHGVDLSAPADPTSRYDARPEWYFLALYQMLKYFPGAWEIVAAMGAPLLFIGALALMPWVDRAPAGVTSPGKRVAPLLVFAVCLLTVAGLGGVAAYEDAHNPRFVEHEHASKEEAVRARKLALEGVPVAGGVAVYLNDPLEQGHLLYTEHCSQCHRLGRQGPPEAEQKGPNLTGLWSRQWLTEFMRNPDSPRYYGRTKLKEGMKPVELPEAEMADLVEYVYSLRGAAPDLDAARVKRGALLFEDKNCDLCHERDNKTSGQGPNLAGHASPAWARRLLENPGAPLYYGEKNDMPSFGKKLTAVELDRLATYLTSLK